jgi:hypothetical protein
MAKRAKLVARKQLARKVGLEEGVALLKERYGGRLVPTLEGLAYRFTIWLPVQSRGKVVFTEVQQDLLFQLFHVCCGGCSQSTLEGFPPWSGSWLPEDADEPIVDHHVLLIVYTLQDSDALHCLRQLKWILQQEHVAAQQVVLIEQVPVHLVEAAELA